MFICGISYAQKKPEFKLKYSQKEIELGDSIIVNWTSHKADSIIFIKTGEKLPLTGQLVLYPECDEKFIFIAYRRKKGKRKRIINTTVHSPEIKEFYLPCTASDETPFKIVWKTDYTEKVIIEGLSDSLPLKGELEYLLDTSRTFRIKAQNRFGREVSWEREIKINYVEELIYPSLVIFGNNVEIRWKYKNTKEVRFAGIDSVFAPIDTLNIIADSVLLLDLYVFRNNGDTLFKSIKPKVIIPHIVYFKGTNYIFFGNKAKISWKTIGAESVSISGFTDSLPPVGSMKISPSKTKTYTMSINHHGFIETKRHTVNVIRRNYILDKKDIKNVSKGMRIDFEVFNTDLSNYPKEIKLYILAVDMDGNFIMGLAPPYGTETTSKKYFKSLVETLANGNKHKVESFKVEEVRENIEDTCSIVLTLDYSGSMYGCIGRLEKACVLYAKKKRIIDSVAIVKFDNDLSLELPLTNEEKQIQEAIFRKRLNSFGGSTALYAAIDEGLISLETTPKNKQMVLFTDGFENSSLLHFGKRAVFAQQVAKKAKKNKVKINVVTLGKNVNEPLLKFLSVITGGNYYNIVKPNDIVKVMSELPLLNRNYYVITYKPLLGRGSRKISLFYNNNSVDNVETKRDIYVGDNFDLSKFESIDKSYWIVPKYGWSNKVPVSPPQAVANFDFNKCFVKKKYYQQIDKYIEFMKTDKTICVTIVGHTDMVGNEQDCVELSLERAKKVSIYMEKNGIEQKRIKIIGAGKKQPVWTSENASWKARENRRVELILYN